MPASRSLAGLRGPEWGRVARLAGLVILFWAAFALVLSFMAYAASLRRGIPQPWWPSLGYSLAIFSIWALMTPIIAGGVISAEARIGGWRRIGLYALGLPLVCAVHVFAFAAIYWPIYNDGGRIASRWAMGERMLLANLDTNALLYALLVVGSVIVARRRRREGAGADGGSSAMSGADDFLTIRSRGGFVRVPLAEVERIEAAGDYCEVHAGASAQLIDESLVSLAARLPPEQFARVHRGSIVALGDVIGLRGVGRGDALLRLKSGAELRLSRRYRREFEERMARR